MNDLEKMYKVTDTPERIRVTTIIEFEDKGQDFLRWELNEEGVVIDCIPFQGSIWCGKYVFQHEYLYAGHKVFITDVPVTKLNQPLTEMNYRVASVSVRCETLKVK